MAREEATTIGEAITKLVDGLGTLEARQTELRTAIWTQGNP
jgi:hypothetical protein